MVLSGELSIVKVDVADDEEDPLLPPELVPDEHAATPAHTMAAAAMPATLLRLSSLSMLSSCCC
jgi:hypothetical protein